MDQKAKIAIEVTRQGMGAQQAEQDLSKLEQQAQKTDKAGAGLAASWKQFGAVMAALASARIIAESVREFEEFEKATKLLDGSLIASGQHTKEYSDELKSLATSMANMAKVQDEAVMSAEATLVQFGAMREEMPRLIKNILDMSAAGFDLQTVARNLGAAVSGEFDPMRRLLKMDFPEGADNAEKMAVVLETMESRFSGLAESQGATTSGLRELGLAFDDTKKALGEFISEGLGSYTKNLAAALSVTTEFIQWFARLGSNNLGAQEQFNLIDTQLNLRSELTQLILQKEADAEITADQSAALREYIRTVSTVEDMYRRLAAARAFLNGQGELPTNTPPNPGRAGQWAGPMLPDNAAAKALAEFQKELELDAALNSAAFGVRKPEMMMIALQAEKQREFLRNLAPAYFQTEAQREAMMATIDMQETMKSAALAVQGAGLANQYLSPKEQAQAEYQEKFFALNEYYNFQKLMAVENAEELKRINAQEAEVFKRLNHEKMLATSQTYAMMQQVGEFALNSFSAGFSQAFVGFVSGTKEAKEAFGEFAASFMQGVSQMIMQMLILRALKSAFGGALGLADGGIVQAAAGGTFAGVSTVSSPTYFPKFNVLAGEAGAEHLAVFARSRSVNVAGINAIIGNVGASRLAMIDAGHLAAIGSARKAADGIITGGGDAPLNRPMTGTAVIELRPKAGFEARIIDNSIEGAQVRILNDLHEDSAISTAVKRLTA